MELLNCKNLTKAYVVDTKIIDDISFTLTKGKVIGLLGLNGAGKTTLIKLINNLISLDQGTILVNNHKLGLKTKNLISYLPENNHLDLNIKVNEAIEYYADFYEDFDSYKAYGLLGKLKISSDARLKDLSKGTLELTRLILVMSRQTCLYILDEPVASVDPKGRDLILDLILKNISSDSTVLVTTYLIKEITPYLDEAIIMEKGKIKIFDTVPNIENKYQGALIDIIKGEIKC